MREKNLDAFVGTRLVSACYVTGCSVPYRAAVYVPSEGDVSLHVSVIEQERIRDETWIDNTDVEAWIPQQGMTWMEQVATRLNVDGLDGGCVGVEKGVSPRGLGGTLTYEEHRVPSGELDAELVDACDVMNEVVAVKGDAEIEALREGTAIVDEGMEAALDALEPGVTETEVVGAAEKRMRELGSTWNWPIPGGSEISSGYRGGYSRGGCTPPTNKTVERGEFVMVDLHCTHDLYYSDLAHNVLLGEPTDEQRDMIDVFVETAEFLLNAVEPGVTMGEVTQQVNERLSGTGYEQHVPPVFGHGIGTVGHDGYPVLSWVEPYASVEFEENMVQELYLQVNQPGVGGLRFEVPVVVTCDGAERLTETPIEPEVGTERG
jgi:Xaa-Pro aminopeptidase